ncbi:hypothetical protein F3Y22_tig00110831pilonHSYRG00459 [Hibiscus syriacus]|uniref:DUF7086 domain-containing protein n=1 Tax=Hibiscus syriacus TaxID=106335 RepID=A0A6A2ZLV7_HIBSY|nr:hypothetical protein F3Y22_tig00110831pilonHSYRG00459 [Hibiscus syriacus]
MFSLPSPVQTMLYESPTSHPLHLSANHPLHAPLEELSFPPSPADATGSGTITGSGLHEPYMIGGTLQQMLHEKGKARRSNHRATVHELQYLLSNGIRTITGDVQCKRCERQYQMEYDLIEKYTEIGGYIAQQREAGDFSQEESHQLAILAANQMIGCCTLEHLNYFCKHTNLHRTAAKDRVIYLAYLCLCKQLDPTGPFDRCFPVIGSVPGRFHIILNVPHIITNVVFSMSSRCILIWLYLENPSMNKKKSFSAVLSTRVSICDKGKLSLGLALLYEFAFWLDEKFVDYHIYI